MLNFFFIDNNFFFNQSLVLILPSLKPVKPILNQKMSKPIIYWHPFSAPCRGTWLVAQNLGIDIDFRLLNLAANEQNSPEFLKINPMHCVPTLNDDGYVIWESRAISTYLANSKVSETSLYPTDPKIRGLIDSLLYFDATVLYLHARAITRPIIYEGVTSIGPEKIEAVQKAYNYLQGFLSENEFVAGEFLTVADCHLIATVATTKALGIGLENHQKIERWYENSRKTVKGFEEHEKFARDYTDMIRSKLK